MSRAELEPAETPHEKVRTSENYENLALKFGIKGAPLLIRATDFLGYFFTLSFGTPAFLDPDVKVFFRSRFLWSIIWRDKSRR